MEQSIIINQISFLSILVIVGFFTSKIGVIKEDTRDALVKIIFNITLPLLLFTNFSKLELTPELLRGSLVVIIIAFLVIVFMMLFGMLSSLLFRMKHEQRSIFIAHHAFGNILYIGFPVVTALFGELGLFYASIYALVSILMLWTVGIYLIARKGGMPFAESLKRMLNPNSIAIIAGFVLFLLRIKIPVFLLKPFVSLGGTTIYLSMLYIGALLGLMKIAGVFGNLKVYLTSFNKNFLMPLILILVFRFLPGGLLEGIDSLIIAVVIVEAAMPCMANVVIVAKMYKVDDQLATANVFMSTLVSLVSLPLIWFLFNMFN
ncbi:MAG: AEC family transporter [Marinilabiliaceae bacterium]|jgi:predicted permease|nr:AEC family transporter [Marinilabiliaceae bacterium]